LALLSRCRLGNPHLTFLSLGFCNAPRLFSPKLHTLFFLSHEQAKQATRLTAIFIALLHLHEIMDTCDMVYQQPSPLVQLDALVGDLLQGGRGIVCTCGDNVNTWCLYHFYLVL
jgi:hypothetical protein